MNDGAAMLGVERSLLGKRWRARLDDSMSGLTLAQAIDELEGQFPGISDRLLDDGGELRHFVNVYVNGEDVQFLDGLQTAIKGGDEVSIVPAVAGG